MISSARRLYKGKSVKRIICLCCYRRCLKRYCFSHCSFRDDLRTANIICDSPEGVTCLVIDRETFNQLISNLDEIKHRYDDEGTLERRK